jgi:hypothetical protein
MIPHIGLPKAIADSVTILRTFGLRSTMMPSIRGLDGVDASHPWEQVPLLLLKGTCMIESSRWGWHDTLTKRENYFVPAELNFALRGVIPATGCVLQVTGCDTPYYIQVTGRDGAPLFLAAAWKPSTNGAPLSCAVMLTPAGPDMPDGCHYEPVVVDPAHVKHFIDHTKAGHLFQRCSPPGTLQFEQLEDILDSDVINDPFGMACDARFFKPQPGSLFQMPTLPPRSK